MTGYVVHYSQAHQLPRQIGGLFETLAQAEAAARRVGAIGDGERSGHHLVYDVEGHEGEDDYGIWIEVPPDGKVEVRDRSVALHARRPSASFDQTKEKT
jgi:hypothetical protein